MSKDHHIYNQMFCVMICFGLTGHPRTVLIALLVLVRGGSYMVEQPGSSLLPEYIRLVWLSRITKVSCSNQDV